MNAPQKTLMIADDHPIFRQGLRKILQRLDWLEVVAEAESGDSALAQMRYLQPDMAMLDLAMPGTDGLKVLEKCRELHPQMQVIIVTSYDDPAYLERAMELGARGYVVKDSAGEVLVECLTTVAAGSVYISPSLNSCAPQPPALAAGVAEELDLLTDAERRVLSGVADFKTSKEIARELDVSYRTVQNHRANIAEKLGLTGRHALIRFARTHREALEGAGPT
ncbi:response regulator transcription factor [Wenzhouxiangella limi]|uniref:Response regulator transcription factor n=1 Tax=Wenzhouxiangella limi TaxID=2707351 RepID=A0A845V1M0_9GAMM|nr:response regulator transcription factor [Wenzhouxiangella limi]NDY96988.1 response regulator transcription factor [Wenzhouxiangella limi]